MNLGDAMQSLTVSQSVITDYYEKEEYAHAEFKVKDTLKRNDLMKYICYCTVFPKYKAGDISKPSHTNSLQRFGRILGNPRRPHRGRLLL